MQAQCKDFVGFGMDGNKNRELYGRVDLSKHDADLDKYVLARRLPKGENAKFVQPNKRQNWNNSYDKHDLHEKGFRRRAGRALTNEKLFQTRGKEPELKIKGKATGLQTENAIVKRIEHLRKRMTGPKSLVATIAVQDNQLSGQRKPAGSVEEMLRTIHSVELGTDEQRKTMLTNNEEHLYKIILRFYNNSRRERHTSSLLAP